MDNVIFVKEYSGSGDEFAVNEKEIFRYAGYGGLTDTKDDVVKAMLSDVICESKNDLSYRICYRKFDLSWHDGFPRLPFPSASKNLAKCLGGSEEAVIFAATIGHSFDRRTARYRLISPTKALLMQAYGAERVERLCDVFCGEMAAEAAKEGFFLTPRFSPGYGDLPLEVQKDVFRILECGVRIGISLNESLLMTPSKSVTAIFGLRRSKNTSNENKCAECGKKDCLYRSADNTEACDENT